MDRVSRGRVVRSGGRGIRSGGMMDKGSMMSSMDRGRVNGGRVVRSRGRGIRSGVVRGGMGMFGVFDSVVFADLSFVFDISVVLFVLIDEVIDDLGAAIGQLHGVLSCKIRNTSILVTLCVIQSIKNTYRFLDKNGKHSK